MKTFKTNDNGDPIVQNGLFVTIEGLEAVMQSCEQAAKTLLGEMIYFANDGVDYENTLWSRVNPLQFEASFRASILKVDNVISVDDFTITKKDDVIRYFAIIRTTFGQGLLNDRV